MKIYVIDPKTLRVLHTYATLGEACKDDTRRERWPDSVFTEAHTAVGAIASVMQRLKVTGQPVPAVKDIVPRFAARQVAA